MDSLQVGNFGPITQIFEYLTVTINCLTLFLHIQYILSTLFILSFLLLVLKAKLLCCSMFYEYKSVGSCKDVDMLELKFELRILQFSTFNA